MRHFVSLISVSLLLASGGCFRSFGSSDGDPRLFFDGGPRLDASPRPWDGGWDDPDVGPDRDAGWDDPDVGPDRDAGSPTCEADAVEEIQCPMFLCDEPARWYWNGYECFPIECGACSGDACETGAFERETCEAEHDTCEPSVCRSAGGTWRFWGETDCGFVCGFPSGDDCIQGPTCDCGANATFDPLRGCVTDDCFIDPEVPTPETLCLRTGGDWGGFCAHSHCGVPSPLACAQPACHCEWPQVFDDRRGCVEGEACYRGDGGCDHPGVVCPQGTMCDAGGTCEGVVCPF